MEFLSFIGALLLLASPVIIGGLIGFYVWKVTRGKAREMEVRRAMRDENEIRAAAKRVLKKDYGIDE